VLVGRGNCALGVNLFEAVREGPLLGVQDKDAITEPVVRALDRLRRPLPDRFCQLGQMVPPLPGFQG